MDIKKEVSEIMALAYEVSTTTNSDVFVNYAGHVNTLRVYTHDNGWVGAVKRDLDFDIRLKRYEIENKEDFEENLRDQLEEVQLFLIMLGVANE